MRTRTIIAITLTLDMVFFGVNLAVFLYGGSKAVLSQALYAVTDVVGGFMIYWGMRPGLAEPSSTHPFGRGRESFFWAFTAGLVTFSLTGFLVLVEGVLQILNPTRISAIGDDLVAVAGTLVVALGTLLFLLYEFAQDGMTIRKVMESDHQEMKIVLVQDAVGLVGGAAALTGIYLVFLTGNSLFDGLAASVVGLMLIGTGFVFAADARDLLVGKGISAKEGKTILSIVERYPYVRHVQEIKSMIVGPDEVLVALRVNFVDELTTDEVEMHVDQLRRFVMGESPRVRYLVVEPVGDTARKTTQVRIV